MSMADDASFPPAQGVRRDWLDLPPVVRRRIETALGASVVHAQTQPGGFSPGLAALLSLQDGRRVFAKAVGPQPNPDTPALHRREIAVLRALPEVPGVPRLLLALGADEHDRSETGMAEGWVVLICEAASGSSPTLPWRADDLERVLIALLDVWAALTPSPLHPPTVRLARDVVQTSLNGWTRLRLQRPRLEGLDDWSTRHLDALAALEVHAPQAVDGETLLHFDLRADNLLLEVEGAGQGVWVVDWPHACVGAAWFDVVCFAPSVSMQGGPLPEVLLARLPSTLQPSPDALFAGVACLAGYFTERALQPPPPGLPTVRAFQAAQGDIARAWLRRLTGWT
ncbi:phosphotransferase family protein [Deinococcus ruber]|nr:phosphotransferase [Deinococcus ruber]